MTSSYKMHTVYKMFFLCCLLLSAVFTGGRSKTPSRLSTKQYHKLFKNLVNKSELEKNLRFFSSIPHMETSIRNDKITNYIRDKWKSYGFEVEEPEYEVLLSLPQENKPNKVSIINNETKKAEFIITGQLKVSSGDPKDKKVFKYTPFLAFAPNGTVEGELVYANKGSATDLKELEKRGISLKGKIIIMNSISGQIRKAKLKGAIGAIIYPDPKWMALEGYKPSDTYPHKPWMPPDGVQSKSLSNTLGDDTTPLIPSTPGMYKRPLDQTRLADLMPAQTISYKDASILLSRMKGKNVPPSMAGSLNISYKFGPGFKPNSQNKTPIVRLEVNNQYVTKTIRNVIATIPGSEEPDRYVLIGNHKDALAFGASDPSSGTATLMEISRILWKLTQKGWRPRRTIKLCSWAGEEFEIVGSSEWVEENEEILKARAVAYLNTDVAIGGNFLLAPQSSTILGDLILNHAKAFQDPSNSSQTIYDNMYQIMPKYQDYPREPYVYDFRYFSDTLPFSIFMSLPAADFSYFFGFKNVPRLFTLYQSQYDTFYWIKKFADPDFRYLKTMTQFLGSMLLDVSDSVILPFSVRKLSKCVDRAYNFISSSTKLDSLQMTYLRQAKDAFSAMVNKFECAKQSLASQQKQKPLAVRAINDQLSGIEQKFVSPHSKTDWPTDKTLLFNCKFWNIKKVMELKNISGHEKETRLKFEMSLMIHALKTATKFLKPMN